jgi:hypothetical protein
MLVMSRWSLHDTGGPASMRSVDPERDPAAIMIRRGAPPHAVRQPLDLTLDTRTAITVLFLLIAHHLSYLKYH